MTYNQVSPDRRVRDLWNRGKFWEIFGFSNGDFTGLELARRYAALTKVYRENPEDMLTIDDAFATLNAPLTRQFYEGCRMVMQRIRREVGDAWFGGAENRIWLDLWNWVSERWQEPPEEIINALKTKYGHPSGTGTNRQTETWSSEGLKPTDLDSVMAAEAFTREWKCQRCGKFDHTLRVVGFPYVISILVASFRRFESGVFCHNCRCIKSIWWAIFSLFFGWWSLWGFFWNIGALIDNFRGGKMPQENNEPLVAKLAWANTVLGRIAEAKAALKELFKYSPSEDTLRLQKELDEKYPAVPPVKVERLRLGYLTIVFAILGVYAVAGVAMFGGTSAPSTYTPPSSPQPVRGVPSRLPIAPSPQRTPLIRPSNSDVKWDDSSDWTTASTFTVTGSVRNTHDAWSMTSVRIEVEIMDKNKTVVQQSTVTVSPSTIPPGGTGRYHQVITTPRASESGNTGIRWTWTPPK